MTIDTPEEEAPVPGVLPHDLLHSLPEHTPDDVRAALENGEVRDALRAAIEAGDLGLATDVLRIGWFALLRDDSRRPSAHVLEQLTPSQLKAHPLLAMALGLIYNADRLRRAKAVYYFGLAAAGIRSRSTRDTPVERALVSASESAAFRLLGKTGVSVRSARTALRALEDIHDERASLIGYLPRLYSQLGTSLYYGGHDEEALHVFERGFAEHGTADPSSFDNLAMMLGIHALNGDMSEVTALIDVAREEPWSDLQRATYAGTFYRIAEAVLALERLDVSGARAHLDAMVHDRRSIEHWVAIARVEALTSLMGGEPARALAELEAFVVLRGVEGAARSTRYRLASVRSVLHLALGNYDAAATVLKHDGGTTAQDHVDRARLALAADRTSDALRSLRDIAGRRQTSRTRIEALTIEAAIGLRFGHGRRTDALIEQLVSVMRASGQRLALRLLPQADLDAVLIALRRAGAADLADAVTAPSVIDEVDRPSLTPREMAVLRVLARTASVSDIATELFVSTNTVKSQLRSVYRKLGARNRDEALAAAIHLQLLRADRS